MNRFRMRTVYPDAYKAMDGFEQLIKNSGLDRWYVEMIKIRASYLNGCAYCVDMHVRDALKLGVDPAKISVVPVWKEALNVFSKEEQAILQLTEEMTLIHQHGVSDETYNTCLELFGEKGTAALMMAAITINAWNRIGVGLKMEPVGSER